MADLARRAGLLSGWVLLGLLVWGMGVFALGRATEDRCASVTADRGYGAYCLGVPAALYLPADEARPVCVARAPPR